MKNNYKFLFIIILVSTSILAFTQGLINNGAKIVVQGNANLLIIGSGNIENNGTITCNTNSNVKFMGNALQEISGSNQVNFYNLLIDNTGAGLALYSNIGITNEIRLYDGDVDLKNQTIDLGTTGNLVNEASSQRVKATNAVGLDGMGTGTIRASRTNPTGNVAGLGLNITPSSALGSTVIIRGHEQQAGTGSYASNWSIFRYYEIQPTNITSININFNYYPAFELNGHSDGSLIMFQEAQYYYGGWAGPVFWEPKITGNTSPIANGISEVSALNYIKLTLGSDLIPLPIELISFNINCEDNLKAIKWETSSETNNDYFVLEKSVDGINFIDFEIVAGAGNSTELRKYIVYDNSLEKAYYRLKQVDINGVESTTEIKYSNCTENIESLVYYYQDENVLTFVLESFQQKEGKIMLYDIQGKLVYENLIFPSETKTYHQISKCNLSNGSYILYISNKNNESVRKNVIVL
ncbi:MAG: hypothetical protein JXR58_07520 [Bacteroidales bacterium]|nr:hypothetical protein [Bacteroidales bacterium]